MKPATIVGIVVLALIVIGLVVFVGRKPAAAPGSSGGSATTTAFAVPAAGPYTEHTGVYDITANYPATTTLMEGVGPQADAAATALMRGFVSDTITQFKSSLAELAPNATTTSAQESLSIVYLISYSKQTISYIFTIYEDTGGAHGNTYFKTFTFDTSTGALLSLGDLFAPGSDYLDTLSQIARARLPSIIGQYADADMIAQGTTPDDQNFENFFLDNGNLDLLFPPYQVAPYAAGAQTLPISLSVFGASLKSDYKY